MDAQKSASLRKTQATFFILQLGGIYRHLGIICGPVADLNIKPFPLATEGTGLVRALPQCATILGVVLIPYVFNATV
jgi:hypothetical protein